MVKPCNRRVCEITWISETSLISECTPESECDCETAQINNFGNPPIYALSSLCRHNSITNSISHSEHFSR